MKCFDVQKGSVKELNAQNLNGIKVNIIAGRLIQPDSQAGGNGEESKQC